MALGLAGIFAWYLAQVPHSDFLRDLAQAVAGLMDYSRGYYLMAVAVLVDYSRGYYLKAVGQGFVLGLMAASRLGQD
jgi:hypothetical protein